MANDTATTAASGLDTLSTRLENDLVTLDKELNEIDLLITQAKAEAGRHEGKRSIAADKFETLTGSADVTNRLEQATTLIGLTRRAALMETQVEVLEGKRRTLARYRDGLADYVEALATIDPVSVTTRGAADVAADAPMPANVARVLLGEQEDLRREIARAMHDGPAQSLTNIVLQAQIVERLVTTDPAASAVEVGQLVAMVQQTLDATKSFIFDVRPMVLDDLGLVPTLRRATRERSNRAGIPVEFESMGQDRRLPMDLESAPLPDARRSARRLPRRGSGARGDAARLGRPADDRRGRDAGGRRADQDLGHRDPDRGSRQVAPTGARRAGRGASRGGARRRPGGRARLDRGAARHAVARDPGPRGVGRRRRRAPGRWRSPPSRDRHPTAGPGAVRRDIRRVSAVRGQGLVEYGLIAALTSALTLVWLVVFGGTVSDALTAIGIAIDQATGG